MRSLPTDGERHRAGEGGEMEERKKNKAWWRSPSDSLLSPSCVPDSMVSLVRHLVITT